MKTFLSIVSILLSLIALGGTGLALANIFQLQQSLIQLNASVQKSPPVSNLPQADSSSTFPITEPSPQASTEIQPGQFVQYAFEDKAQVELLSVKRIQNPEDGKRNIVNIQMRIRNLKGGKNQIIVPSQTKARNPETSETYESFDAEVTRKERPPAKQDGVEIDRSTSVISLRLDVDQGSSADAYVWMVIPEEIKMIDVFVPDTAEFSGVPISE